MYSTPKPACWCILEALTSDTEFQTHYIVSLFDNLSKTPSQAITIKSWSAYILNDFISGVAITTLGFPPLDGILASKSPKVLDTDNLPGKTL